MVGFGSRSEIAVLNETASARGPTGSRRTATARRTTCTCRSCRRRPLPGRRRRDAAGCRPMGLTLAVGRTSCCVKATRSCGSSSGRASGGRRRRGAHRGQARARPLREQGRQRHEGARRDDDRRPAGRVVRLRKNSGETPTPVVTPREELTSYESAPAPSAAEAAAGPTRCNIHVLRLQQVELPRLQELRNALSHRVQRELGDGGRGPPNYDDRPNGKMDGEFRKLVKDLDVKFAARPAPAPAPRPRSRSRAGAAPAPAPRPRGASA